MARALPSKLIGETITVEFNFADVLEWAETISDQAVAVEVTSGVDPGPSEMLSGSASASGSSIFQDITAGLGGVIYNLVATATGSTGAIYVKIRRLAVLTDNSSYAPGRTLELTGALPDATPGVAYSEPLQISGGYPPYDWDDVVAGAAPFWMGFSVSGSELICAGLPDETVSTTYTFTPQVLDSANNTADEPQVMDVVDMELAGDVPDGYVGQVVSGTYTQTFGVEPVSYIVFSGTFPAGLTLASDGSYSGTLTTEDTYSWQIQGTDAVGNVAYLDDTCEVKLNVWYTNYDVSTFERSSRGTYDLSWTAGALVVSGYCYYHEGVLITSRVNAVNGVYESLDDGLSWATTGSTGLVSGGGGRLLFKDPYIFLCAGVHPLKRYNGTSWGQPSADTDSRASSIALIGSTIIVASIYKSTVSRSSDNGATWENGLTTFTSGNTGSPLLLAVGGTLYILRTNAAAVTEVLSSSDLGDNWVSVYTFPDSGSSTYEPGDFIYTGSTILACQKGTGKTAYKHDGGGWTLSDLTGADVNQFAPGEGKILAGCRDGSIYQSLDDGEAWTLESSPSGAIFIHGITWMF